MATLSYSERLFKALNILRGKAEQHGELTAEVESLKGEMETLEMEFAAQKIKTQVSMDEANTLYSELLVEQEKVAVLNTENTVLMANVLSSKSESENLLEKVEELVMLMSFPKEMLELVEELNPVLVEEVLEVVEDMPADVLEAAKAAGVID